MIAGKQTIEFDGHAVSLVAGDKGVQYEVLGSFETPEARADYEKRLRGFISTKAIENKARFEEGRKTESETPKIEDEPTFEMFLQGKNITESDYESLSVLRRDALMSEFNSGRTERLLSSIRSRDTFSATIREHNVNMNDFRQWLIDNGRLPETENTLNLYLKIKRQSANPMDHLQTLEQFEITPFGGGQSSGGKRPEDDDADEELKILNSRINNKNQTRNRF